MKAHKYWSIVAIVTMVGTFYTGYKGLKAAHKYFAFGSLICMIMAVYDFPSEECHQYGSAY